MLASIKSVALVTFAGSPNRRWQVGHRFAVCHAVPALGKGNGLGLRLGFVADHDPCTRGLGLFEVEHFSKQLLLCRSQGRATVAALRNVLSAIERCGALPGGRVRLRRARQLHGRLGRALKLLLGQVEPRAAVTLDAIAAGGREGSEGVSILGHGLKVFRRSAALLLLGHPFPLAYPARLAFYVAIGFVLAMLAIATAVVPGYFLFEAGLEMMSRF